MGEAMDWMFRKCFFRCRTAPAVLLAMSAVLVCGGCQMGSKVSSTRLIEHQAMIDFSGLKPAEPLPDLKVTAAVPRTWKQVGPSRGALFSHNQWRSPSSHTAVGAAYIRMPLPINTDIMIFFAKREYAKHASDGRILSRWTDALGRDWFEAENSKYHIQGYAIARGFEGWFVYFGYKVDEPLEMSEISQAARCADSFVPMTGVVAKPSLPQPATRPSTGIASEKPSADSSENDSD